MLIDTHTHLDFKDFDNDRDEVIKRAQASGVGRILNVGSSIEGSKRSVALARKHECVYASIGIHPHEAASVTDEVIEDLRKLAKEPKVVAIGEVGLDYYRNLAPKEIQIGAFKKFIRLADELNLPLILHAREADKDVLNILSQYAIRNTQYAVMGVMHCFSGDEAMLKECLDMGLYVSFTCNLTFKNAKALREVAAGMPVERLLLETDAPFLSPQEKRGSRNEPENLTYLVDEWSKILGLSKSDIARITAHNARALFGLGLDEDEERIAYEIRDSLYLNITNRCTNECDFCVRNKTTFVKGHNLRLQKEPSEKEILAAVKDPKKYKEIVFCGYGEPTIRIEVVKDVAKELKKSGARIRMVTNGHGDLINSRLIAKELVGLIDRVSVSLNTDTDHSYRNICKPKFGVRAFKHVIDFARDCAKNGIETEMTCLNLPGVDVNRCEEIAKEVGASFRLRILGAVG